MEKHKAEEDSLWQHVSVLLQMEIDEKTAPSEIQQKLDTHVMPQIEDLDLISKAEEQGASRVRADRVVYSSLITALYNKILQARPERVDEILPYIQGRIRDKDKRIRGNAVSFIFKNIQAIKGTNTKVIAKTMIDLLKNKKKAIRVFYLKIIASNINEFSEMLAPSDVKYLINTFSLVCECYLSEKQNITSFIKKIFAIINRLKYLGKLSLSNVLPLFEVCNMTAPELLPFLRGFYRRVEKEICDPSFLRQLEKEESESTRINLLALVACGVDDKMKVFLKYKEFAQKVQTLEVRMHLFRILKQSKHNIDPALYLPEIQSALDDLAGSNNTEAAKAALDMYMIYAKEDLVPAKEFQETIFKIFKETKHLKSTILLFLDEALKGLSSKHSAPCSNADSGNYPELAARTASTLNPSALPSAVTNDETSFAHDSFGADYHENNPAAADELLPSDHKNKNGTPPHSEKVAHSLKTLIQTILFYLVEYNEVEALETFLNYFNPFEYGAPSSIYSASNTVTFYTVLWYMHTLRESPAMASEHTLDDIAIHKITHRDFDLSLEFYSVLFILSESSQQCMHKLKNDLFAQMAAYLSDLLDSVRASREFLRDNYKEIVYTIDGLVVQLNKKNNTYRPVLQLAQHSLASITALMLYLLNSENTIKNLQTIKSHMEPALVQSIDIEKAKEYGILSEKNTKKYEKFMGLLSKRAAAASEIDLSSVTEHSVSTNLDTNIIEGISKIEDQK
ncbi:hypothetical protein NEMIN01_1213 [Nematocida minor]|uniref:uncharacterized protein n=1 Tax=Nematocida minor TaxID=1912983 RepID=UPI00221E4C4A|nr:uncharacterized protein NEMIN01_1213 [Nematocida minor]KAI5190811.1 hypothetical protein NEMIN01_1213 [Nematocida minor]